MLKLEELFDLQHTDHAELFNGVEYAWEVLPKLKDYIKESSVGEGTVIEEGVVIKDRVIIGKNCLIRSGAYIRENTIIGDNVTVGASSEIKNSLIFNNAEIPHLNYVGDSVVGYKAHLAAGVVCSNVKIPMAEIVVKIGDDHFPTGLQKFGSLVGDNVEVGCNSVLNPGSVIGKNCLLYPLTSWRGVLEPNQIVKNRQQQEIVLKRLSPDPSPLPERGNKEDY